MANISNKAIVLEIELHSNSFYRAWLLTMLVELGPVVGVVRIGSCSG